jgi:hypothetical protein
LAERRDSAKEGNSKVLNLRREWEQSDAGQGDRHSMPEPSALDQKLASHYQALGEINQQIQQRSIELNQLQARQQQLMGAITVLEELREETKNNVVE